MPIVLTYTELLKRKKNTVLGNVYFCLGTHVLTC